MFARRVRLLAACALAATMIVAYDVGTDKVLSQSASVENAADHADPEDFIWDSADITEITLNGDSMTISGEGAFAEDGRLTVTSAGTYRLSGALTDGQIIVDTEDESLVRLILGGVTLGSSTGAPINIVNAEEAMIVLEAGSQNSISDAAVYVYESAGTDEPNAAIFSKSDLTFYGDGLKSDNEEDAARGTISIAAGVITVTAGGDAISAQTDVLIAGGAFVLMSGGGEALPDSMKACPPRASSRWSVLLSTTASLPSTPPTMPFIPTAPSRSTAARLWSTLMGMVST